MKLYYWLGRWYYLIQCLAWVERLDHKGRSHQAHLAQTFGGWCRFGSAPTQAQISHDVGYCRINLKTVSCYNKATKTFYQDAMSYVRLNLIQDLATYKTFSHLVTTANSFKSYHSSHQ